MSKKTLFNDGWNFTKQSIGTSLEEIKSDKILWQPVDLPHDWLIYNAKNLYETSEGWYKKDFIILDKKEKIISIRFEGVYMNSSVYINDTFVGEWKYGYSTFEFDITKYLKEGKNTILVSVKHQEPNSRWYSGAGIYRNVWLKESSLVHIVSDGIYISTKQYDDHWDVEVDTEIIGEYGNEEEIDRVIGDRIDKEVSIRQRIYDTNGNRISLSKKDEICKNTVTVNKQVLRVENPELWSLDECNLYELHTEILRGDELLDSERIKFGFRTIQFDPNRGFFLNNQHIKLNGVCLHHDLGSLGAAVNKEALRRQLEIMKEMGANAIRTSHNMPAVELMELADEMGFLIDSEAFDMWELPKTKYDYARFFKEWCKKDVRSFIRRDRNHPSIIMWSIGNEIYDTHGSEHGLDITKELKQYVLEEDPKKNGYITFGSNYIPWENTQNCARELDVVGYNYAERLYEEHHKRYPDWCIYGSETAARVQSRGIYHFPASVPIKTHEDLQCSSLENCKSGYGDRTAQDSITIDRDVDFSAGQFIWTGFDYIGEPSPYFTKNSYYGQADTAGFKKDTYYLYQSVWTDYKTNPMVHILPHWDFNEGQLIDIRTYSNAPKVELFFNNKSLGVVEINVHKDKKLSGEWQIPYEKGVLRAVAYDENNKIIAEDIQSSFGDSKSIKLNPNKTVMKADGLDLIFIEISTVDAEGTFVANSVSRMEVEVTGAGRLIGLDNGDSTDYDQYKGNSRKLFSGKLLAIIGAKQEPGEIKVKVSSNGLNSAELSLEAMKTDRIEGVSSVMENTKIVDVISSDTISDMSQENRENDPYYVVRNEVPVRKIELSVEGTRHLNKENPITKVTATIHPANATYDELEWKAVTNSGIVTNIANVEILGNVTVVRAIGDGEFRLRCTCKNGKEAPEIISEYEFDAIGMGSATIDPYEFVSGSFSNISNVVLDEVLYGGVAAKDEPTYIGFKGVDFGEVGSDEITIPIIRWFKDDPVSLEVWEGMPEEEDSLCLVRAEYQANFIWQTYQSNTYKLSKKLKGIKTICIVIAKTGDEDIYVKGFSFTKHQKAYETLTAKENNRIYGDSFTILDEAIENIGNNVSIEYDNMNFDHGIKKIVICGRTHNENDSIHIIFNNEDGEKNQIAEFTNTKDYVEREFLLDNITGEQKVKFVFLPGCNFDFKWFRFE